MKRALLVALLLCAGCATDSGRTAAPPAPTVSPTATVAPAPPAAAVLPTASAVPLSPTVGAGQFVNPVINQDFPDPDALKVGDTYYVYATNGSGHNIQAARSKDLVNWEILGDALPALPPWAEVNNTWAPEVNTTADGKSYIMYFAARKAGTHFQCIGMATGATPDGHFHSTADAPFICPEAEGGAIDPSVFVDSDDSRYLLWKNDGNCCGAATHLYIQKLSDDGQKLLSPPVSLVQNDLIWESSVVEAPTLWKHDSKYYLFYSANAYNTEKYAIGVAESDSVLGPYHKAADPLVHSRLDKNPVVGPGGQDVLVDPKGRTWMLYHAWDPTITFRTLNIDPLDWKGDTPIMQGPNRSPEPRPAAP